MAFDTINICKKLTCKNTELFKAQVILIFLSLESRLYKLKLEAFTQWIMWCANVYTLIWLEELRTIHAPIHY